MLFTNVLTYAIAFASATPMVAALYHWDAKLQLYTLGEAPSAFKNPGRYSPRISAEWMGLCNGGDIPEGGYGCATFVEDATVIYQCQKWTDGSMWLKKVEICAWSTEKGGQCVKNQPKKGGKKFHPERSGDDAVCVKPEVLGGQPWKPKPEEN